VVLVDRSLLKGEAPRLSADFNHPLSYESPFKFPRHLIRSLEIDNIIAMSAINIHSAIFKLKQHGNGHGNRNGHETETDNTRDMDMATDTDMDMLLANFC
jgi:hypothetical protein